MRLIQLSLILFALILHCACSLKYPVAPGQTSGQDLSGNTVTPANGPILQTNESAHTYLGYFDITIDKETGSAEIVPFRLTNVHLNARKFLEEYPCPTCLVISGLYEVGQNEWLIDVQLIHPFFGLDIYSAFDLRLIMMFDPTFTFPGSGLTYPDPIIQSGGALLNADGYTTLFNPLDYPPGGSDWIGWEYQKGKYATPDPPSSTLNPYKDYFKDQPRRYFGCTTADTQTFNMRLPADGPLHFGYVIDVCWEPALIENPSGPDDFPLNANRPEPFSVVYHVQMNTLWSDPITGGGGGILQFLLKVYDHQDPRLVENGGTVAGFKWEIPGMVDWVDLNPVGSISGTDSIGNYMAYNFNTAPVPDTHGQHKMLFGIFDIETGISGKPESTYIITQVTVNAGQSCWSAGDMLSDYTTEIRQSHLQNTRASFIDSDGIYHLFYTDPDWRPHHLTYQGIVLEDFIILPDVEVYNLTARQDAYGGIHLLYGDVPLIKGGHIVYRYIDQSGVISDPENLTSASHIHQFQQSLTFANDGTMLAVWMDSQPQPGRKLCASYYNGTNWSPEMTLKTTYLPTSWITPTVVADSNNVYHIVYEDGEPTDLYYMQFDQGIVILDELIVDEIKNSHSPMLAIGGSDRLYLVFGDTRFGASRGFFKMRDPFTGIWTEDIDLMGFNHKSNRFRIEILPDTRVAITWTDFRDTTRGLYSKIFDPYLSEEEIQAIPDDEIDAPFSAPKNMTRMCMGVDGTLHLVWSDRRPGDHEQLYYSRCTP